MEIDLDGIDLTATSATLSGLHRTPEHPAEQSLRGGTQTRGLLFDKVDPAITVLKQSIERSISTALGPRPPVFAPCNRGLRLRRVMVGALA